MATDPNFPTTPKYASALATVANAAADGTGTIVPLLTAGANGALVTGLTALPVGTVTATVLRLYISQDAGATWKVIDMKLLAAYTLSQTVLPVGQTFVDKNTPDAALRLPAAAKLGVAIGVAQATGVAFNAEYMDY
jgi:hypothetical protein